MKIDIHTHTKCCKSGDAPTRAISPEAFCEHLLSTDVRIVAITNHNVFDFEQFKAIEDHLARDAQVWPGIELDIVQGGSRGHLIVVVSPVVAKPFSDAVETLTKTTHPDAFSTTVSEVLGSFDALKPLYVAHYRQKKPDLSDTALEELLAGAHNPQCVLREVTNALSAGIYISHGHPSIYGSDLHDWSDYETISRSLPDLRLPVDSFEQFCLLLQKDPTTINTALNQKTSDELLLLPFDDGAFFKLRAFNDINVIFGLPHCSQELWVAQVG